MPTLAEAAIQPTEVVDPVYGKLGPFVAAGAKREGLWTFDDRRARALCAGDVQVPACAVPYHGAVLALVRCRPC